MKKLYEGVSRERLEVLGISSDDSQGLLQKFLSEFSIPWAACMEAFDGPVHQTLRVEGIPAYFLLAKDGRILDHWVGGGQAVKRIEAALRALSH